MCRGSRHWEDQRRLADEVQAADILHCLRRALHVDVHGWCLRGGPLGVERLAAAAPGSHGGPDDPSANSAVEKAHANVDCPVHDAHGIPFKPEMVPYALSSLKVELHVVPRTPDDRPSRRLHPRSNDVLHIFDLTFVQATTLVRALGPHCQEGELLKRHFAELPWQFSWALCPDVAYEEHLVAGRQPQLSANTVASTLRKSRSRLRLAHGLRSIIALLDSICGH
mmetsp:Transcript_5444/g.11104  ORF Transcript_5444/g.11104 Transcript_5444/m.11104 type:complete len:224 (+) Transcript_5444:109-780(+)